VSTPLPPPPYVPEAVVRRLGLHASRRLDGMLQGDHARAVLGPGSEPAEARPHVVGDDARRIDWAVTARTGEVHVRTATADRELETTLVVDLTPSMAFGTRGSEKRDLAVAAATGLVHLASGHGDRVGALVLSGTGTRRVPGRSGRDAAAALTRVLAGTPRTAHGTAPALADALTTLSRPPHRRGLVVVLSDLLESGGQGAGTPDGQPGWARPLRILAARSDVVVAQVVDRRELELPEVGTLSLVDPETGRLLEVRATPALRSRYAAAAAGRAERQRAAVRAAGARHVLLSTDRDWLPQLARTLSARHRPGAAPASGVRRA